MFKLQISLLVGKGEGNYYHECYRLYILRLEIRRQSYLDNCWNQV